MGENTEIQWTHPPGYIGGSWNPWHAHLTDEAVSILDLTVVRKGWYCEKVPGRKGCAHCYAAALNMRLGTGLDYAAKSRQWVTLNLDQLNLPRRKQKPHCWFVDSMTDLFGEFYPDDQIKQVVDEMLAVRRHLYIVLTKRHERMHQFLNDFYPDIAQYRHIWWGVSCEDQPSANASIPYLLGTPAALRVVSYEPAVGPVNWDEPLTAFMDKFGECAGPLPRLDWFLIGGESAQGGRQAAPFNVAWARSTIAWCRLHGALPFVKQLGSNPLSSGGLPFLHLHPKGGDMAEWSTDLQVREFPATTGMTTTVAPQYRVKA